MPGATYVPSAIADIGGLQSALDAKAATSHTQAASTISDSTVAGRALLTAATASAQIAALGLGTAAVATVGTAATQLHANGAALSATTGAFSGTVNHAGANKITFGDNGDNGGLLQSTNASFGPLSIGSSNGISVAGGMQSSTSNWTITGNNGLKFAAGNNNPITFAATSFNHSSGTVSASYVNPTDATTGTAALSAIVAQISGTGTGSGNKYLWDGRNTSGTTTSWIKPDGSATFNGGITATSLTMNTANGNTFYVQGNGSFYITSIINPNGGFFGSLQISSRSIYSNNGIPMTFGNGTQPVVIGATGTSFSNNVNIIDLAAPVSARSTLAVTGAATFGGTVQPGTINTTSTPGTVAGQLCISSVDGHAYRWSGSAWVDLG